MRARRRCQGRQPPTVRAATDAPLFAATATRIALAMQRGATPRPRALRARGACVCRRRPGRFVALRGARCRLASLSHLCAAAQTRWPASTCRSWRTSRCALAGSRQHCRAAADAADARRRLRRTLGVRRGATTRTTRTTTCRSWRAPERRGGNSRLQATLTGAARAGRAGSSRPGRCAACDARERRGRTFAPGAARAACVTRRTRATSERALAVAPVRERPRRAARRRRRRRLHHRVLRRGQQRRGDATPLLAQDVKRRNGVGRVQAVQPDALLAQRLRDETRSCHVTRRSPCRQRAVRAAPWRAPEAAARASCRSPAQAGPAAA